MRKAQTSEILGFLLIVIFIVTATLGLKLLKVTEKESTTEISYSAQNQEYFKSGSNTFSIVTEEKTGKSLLELIGICAYLEKKILTFGTPDDSYMVNVFSETEKTLDSIYGEGKWHLDIYHAPRYQMYIIMLLDTSVSMAEEIADIKKNIVNIMDEVESTTDKRVAYKLYFLPGTNYKDDFSDIEENNANFRTYYYSNVVGSTYRNEAWAIGMNNLITEKAGEWSFASARVGIILSDEPPDGCELCGCYYYNDIMTEACCPTETACVRIDDATCQEKETNIQNLITTANTAAINMKIYTLEADPCQIPEKYRSDPAFMSQCSAGPYPYTCSGKARLEEFMTTLSDGTGAKMYPVEDPDQVSEALRDIVLNEPIPDIPYELGSTAPKGKVIQSTVIPVPTPAPGIYAKVILQTWN